jgi:hypothetical protein
MKQSPRKIILPQKLITYSRSVRQDIARILWNLTIYYRVYKSPPLVSLLTLRNILHALTPCYF